MPDPALVAVVAVAAVAVLVSTWNAAADDERAPLAVLLAVAVPALAMMTLVGGGVAGALPAVVGAVGLGALAPGAIRLVARTAQARHGLARVGPPATGTPSAAPLRKAA